MEKTTVRLLKYRITEAFDRANRPSVENERQLVLLTSSDQKAPGNFSRVSEFGKVSARNAFWSRHVSSGGSAGSDSGS
jgi:hypothetical protein